MVPLCGNVCDDVHVGHVTIRSGSRVFFSRKRYACGVCRERAPLVTTIFSNKSGQLNMNAVIVRIFHPYLSHFFHSMTIGFVVRVTCSGQSL